MSDSLFKPSVIGNPSRKVVTSPTIDEAKAVLRQRIAESRFALETKGVEVGGVTIRTDRESQASLSGAVVALSRNPDSLIDWKGADGWVRLDKAQVDTLADLVYSHVQRCFSAERVKQIELDTLTTRDELRAFDPTVELA